MKSFAFLGICSALLLMSGCFTTSSVSTSTQTNPSGRNGTVSLPLYGDEQAKQYFTSMYQKLDPSQTRKQIESLELVWDCPTTGQTLTLWGSKQPDPAVNLVFWAANRGAGGEAKPVLYYSAGNGSVQFLRPGAPCEIISDPAMKAAFTFLRDLILDPERLVKHAAYAGQGASKDSGTATEQFQVSMKPGYGFESASLAFPRDGSFLPSSLTYPPSAQLFGRGYDPARNAGQFWKNEFSDYKMVQGILLPSKVRSVFGPLTEVFLLQSVRINVPAPSPIVIP